MSGKNITLEVQGGKHVFIDKFIKKQKEPVRRSDEDGHCGEAETVTKPFGVDSKT